MGYIVQNNGIPITGTETDNPVTGTVEFDKSVGKVIKADGTGSNYAYVETDGDYITVFSEQSTSIASVLVDATKGVTLERSSVSGQIKVEVGNSNDRVKVTGTVPNFKGLVYVSDYSANYSNRSLIDKGFADAAYQAKNGLSTLIKSLTFSGNYIPAKVSIGVYGNNAAFGAATYFFNIQNAIDMVITSLSVFCGTSSAGANVRMCIYNVTGNVPTTVVANSDTGNLSCSSTGQKEGVFSTPVTLLASNKYMVALQVSNTVVALRTEGSSTNDMLFSDLIYYSCLYSNAAYTFGTFLSNPVIAAGLNSNSLKNAVIYLKVQ